MNGPQLRRFAPDAALAAFFFAVGVYEVVGAPLAEDVVEGPTWLNLLAVTLGTLPLAVRRRWPFWVSVTVFAAMAGRALAAEPLELYPLAIAALVALYTVASYAPLRDAVLAAVVAALAISVAVVNGSGTAATPDPLPSAILLGSIWLVGRVVGVRNERARELHEARDEHAAAAVSAERARIAREMHDAVSHSLAAIVMQSSGAQNILDSDPQRARASLAAIEATGRRGLEEMRRLLGMIGEADAELAPQPALARLGEVVEAVQLGGVHVDVHVEGDERPVPTAVDISAFRIVQESLTNVMKHSGAGRADVTLAYAPDELCVEVVDDGRGRVDSAGAGRGLLGMQERVELLGGSFEAGTPRSGSGFRVAARFPG